MRSIASRPTSKTKRVLAAGALLAVSWTAAGALSTASAATWAAETRPDAWFRCISNCQAGGVGPVPPPMSVKPATSRDQGFPAVGAWSRTVWIHCKTNTHHQAYHVTVRDKNWAGTWEVMKHRMARAINDTSFPVC